MTTKKRRYTQPKLGDPKQVERFVRWQNMGPRSLGDVELDSDTVVRDWVPLRIVSIPEHLNRRLQEVASELGVEVRRIGYAQP